MGNGRDKRKKAKERSGEVVGGKGQAKTDKKTARNEDKKERRTMKALEGNEDDIEALLAQFAIEDKSRQTLTVEADCPPPGGRVSASFVPYTAPKINEIIMFGGEFTELATGKVRVYSDLYRYNTDKKRWSHIISPNGPAPRSAHQAVVHKGCMYVFGGEFTSPNQERFHHFKELWRLELATNIWDMLPVKGGPTARSGHRMAVYKNKVVLFGGYFDNGKDVRYYNDLWELDLADFKWAPLGNMAAGLWPSPRSGCQVSVHADTMFVFGGYSKARDVDDPDLEHGKAMDDVWALDLIKHKWERVKRAGMAPGPRSSFSLVSFRGRAFLFGGASDNETQGGADMSSDFHNDLFTFSCEKRRWFAAELRPPPRAKGDAEVSSAVPDEGASQAASAAEKALSPGTMEGGGEGGLKGTAPSFNPALQALLEAGKNPNSPIYKAAAKIQAQFRGFVVRKAYKLYKLGGVVSEILYSPAAYGLDMSARNMPRPKARIGAQACVVGSSLWLFGGTIEIGEKEITLDDMWSLDLAKLDGWELEKENSMGEEVFAAGASSSEYSTDDEKDSD